VNRFLQDSLLGVENAAEEAGHKVLSRLLLGVSGCLTALAGLGFLCASSFLALSPLLGAGWATFVIGAGLIVLAGVLLALSGRRTSKPLPKAVPAAPPPSPPAAEAGETGSIIAFTAAFVLARYLAGDKQD
jgi:hypothetical protein